MQPNTHKHFIHRCISDILHGLQDGLSEFSMPTRVAVIYSLTPNSPLFVCDPQCLLRGYDPALKNTFLKNSTWRTEVELQNDKARFSHILPAKNLNLDGLITYGGHSGSVFYQMWFTEHHPNICSAGPFERWLEHAVLRFSHDVANEQELYSGISGNFLKEYATHAVRDHLVDECNLHLGLDSTIRIYPVLKEILGISKTMEEGAWPKGQLLFVEPRYMQQVSFLAQFHEEKRPQLDNSKHVRKLLQSVEDSSNHLVSDGSNIVGICDAKKPDFSFLVEFHGRYGFIKTGENKVCSFSDGRFHATTNKAKLVEVEEALLEADSVDTNTTYKLFHIINTLVHQAERAYHGCTLVLDLNNPPLNIPGQTFHKPMPLSKKNLLALAASLSTVDGALHIGKDCHLHAFSCLLDGLTIPGENLARGARYNSALRFSKEHKHVIVVVVSSDRPVSVIKNGIDVNGQCAWHAPGDCVFHPVPLTDWLSSS